MDKRQKTGGRSKGTPNRLTKEIKATLQAVVTDQINELPKIFQELTPNEKAHLLIKLLPYLIKKADSENVTEYEPITLIISDKI